MIDSQMPGVIVKRLEIHSDDRGSFAEVMRAADYSDIGFVQSNHSRSEKGVLRGLHYHEHQADLWYLVSGRAQICLADLRDRATTPDIASMTVAAADHLSIFIPPGVAHGFLALEPLDLIYWVSAYYDPDDEHGIAWNDPTLAIPWQIERPTLSERDAANPYFQWNQIPAFS